MRNLILSAVALAVAMPVSMTVATSDANAQTYRGKNYYRCKKSGGTTGTLLGVGAGALLGSAVGGTGATIAGGAVGGLGGREIERSKNKRDCKKYR